MGLAIGDFNRDGRQDVFQTAVYYSNKSCQIFSCFVGRVGNALLLNNGNRTFRKVNDKVTKFSKLLFQVVLTFSSIWFDRESNRHIITSKQQTMLFGRWNNIVCWLGRACKNWVLGCLMKIPIICYDATILSISRSPCFSALIMIMII